MGKSRYHVPNLDRALDIVELLSMHPYGLARAAIAEKTGLSINMVYRITMTLEERGYLCRDDADKSYRLTGKMLKLGQDSFDDYSLAEQAWDEMVELRDLHKETVQLDILVGAEGVVIERVLGSHPVCMMIQRGMRFPLHNNAPGKILVSGLASGCRARLLKGIRFDATTERTITNMKDYVRELEGVVRRGYALDLQEAMHGVHCVAAPVRDLRGETVAALCITGPADRLHEKKLRKIASDVIAHADRISYKIGYRNDKNGKTARPPMKKERVS